NNVFVAFSESNVLQVVFFSIFTGMVINSLGHAVDPVRDFIHSAAKLVLKMISVIVQLSPYAAFALTAWVIGTQGIEIIFTLGKLFGALLLAFALQYIIFGLIIMVFCKVSPIPFYKKSIEYQMIALSTGSSKASLATTMQVCRQKLGVSESSTSFVLPLGASINMNGLSIKLGMSALFFAQVLGIDLAFGDYIVIILTGTLGSIGGAGIPGAFIIMLPIMLTSVGLPIEGVALLVGIDRVLDLLSTTINITGDATITLVIDSSEGTLDKDMYNS
ncbi:MAG: dicarboxylate/amino acid:cation symporter, partial [Pseudomonadota bacterium]